MRETLAEAWQALSAFFEGDQEWMVWMLGLSGVTFVASLIAVPIVVVKMDAAFFVRTRNRKRPATAWQWLKRIFKNLLGWVLLLMGVAMLVLPGQGLMTMALGVSLIDFPGKRWMQARIVRIGSVYRSINWIRSKADKPPLQLPQ